MAFTKFGVGQSLGSVQINKPAEKPVADKDEKKADEKSAQPSGQGK